MSLRPHVVNMEGANLGLCFFEIVKALAEVLHGLNGPFRLVAFARDLAVLRGNAAFACISTEIMRRRQIFSKVRQFIAETLRNPVQDTRQVNELCRELPSLL